VIIDFNTKSPRMCKLRVRGQFIDYIVICAHSPTEEKGSFYNDVQRIGDDCPRMNFEINGNFGKEDVSIPVSGKYILHAESNDNGSRLINFGSARSMLIGSTMFDHKDIHKMTWKSPGGNTLNQTDHLLIDVWHLSNLTDVRSYSKGENIDYDH
jgi:hypothetical protein